MPGETSFKLGLFKQANLEIMVCSIYIGVPVEKLENMDAYRNLVALSEYRQFQNKSTPPEERLRY